MCSLRVRSPDGYKQQLNIINIVLHNRHNSSYFSGPEGLGSFDDDGDDTGDARLVIDCLSKDL